MRMKKSWGRAKTCMLPGSIVRNWLLPGARQAACSLRKQRALICRVLSPGSALWGTPQRPSSKEDTGAEKPLVIPALGLGWGRASEPSPRELILRSDAGTVQATSRARFLIALRKGVAAPRHEASARSGHTPQRQSRHPEHPAAPGRSDGMKSVHGLDCATLTWLGPMDLVPVWQRTDAFGRRR